MNASVRSMSLVLALLCAQAALAALSSPSAPRARSDPRAPLVVDDSTRIDVNNISMFVTNTGSFAWDKVDPGQPAGFVYPKGSGKTAVFAAGLWVGAKVGGAIRLALSEYADEYGPGTAFGGVPDDPNRGEYRVYKLSRLYANGAARDSALADYDLGAVPHGAPPVSVQPDGSLDVLGDQTCWAVYNDLDPANHHTLAAGTAPLGIEVQQTTFAWNLSGALSNTIFLRFKVINRGSNTLDSTFVSIWTDPDLGSGADDLVGCDLGRSMGFVYNATNNDFTYGSTPPCVAFDFLRGPLVKGGRLGLTSFNKYIGGNDPRGASETYNLMRGLLRDGSEVIDPTTSLPTKYQVPGDPVAGTGWLDSNPTDRRLMLSSGPFTMAPGDSQEIAAAIVVGQGSDRLSSITQARLLDDVVQSFSDTSATAVSLSFARATAEPDRVRLLWYASDRSIAATVYRREPGSAWQALAEIVPDGGGYLSFTDASVAPGGRYGYRLGVREGGTEAFAGEVWVDVPTAAGFALEPPRPNPAGAELVVAFSLPDASPASLDLLDVAGRRVLSQDDGVMGRGAHVLGLGGGGIRAPGVYVLRLSQGGRVLTRRATFLR